MKALHLLAMSGAMAALLVFAAVEADAQQRTASGRQPIPVPTPGHGGGMHRIHGGIFIVERVPVIIEREVVREVPAAPPPPPEPPPPPRKPFVLGSTYASLPPNGCMKLIDGGVSYYYCNGEWYRQMGGGKDAQYRAVAQP